jgi:hypothetical protein
LFATPVATPIAVLRKQGEALGAHTQNFVHGEVETSSPEGTRFIHTLYISAPLLRYKHPLLNISQNQPQFYPVILRETELTKEPGKPSWGVGAANAQELQDRIREFFNEARVKELLRTLISLSNDVAPPEDTSA